MRNYTIGSNMTYGAFAGAVGYSTILAGICDRFEIRVADMRSIR